MKRFHAIEGEQVILRAGGVFKQADLYYLAEPDAKKGELFVAGGGGFIRLLTEGKTSKPNTFWEDMDIEPMRDSMGRLVHNG